MVRINPAASAVMGAAKNSKWRRRVAIQRQHAGMVTAAATKAIEAAWARAGLKRWRAAL